MKWGEISVGYCLRWIDNGDNHMVQSVKVRGRMTHIVTECHGIRTERAYHTQDTVDDTLWAISKGTWRKR